MKVLQPTRKQLLLGISLAAAVGVAAITYQRSNNRLLSVLVGTGAYSLVAEIAEKRDRKVLVKRTVDNDKGGEKPPSLVMAYEKFQRGDIEDAEEELRSVERQDPEEFKGAGAYLLGVILDELGKGADAIHYLRQCTKGPVSKPDGLIRLADLLLDKKELEEAISTYTRAIELDEKNSRVIFNRGVAFGYQDNLSRAYEDWRTASALGNDGASKLLEKYESYISEEVSEDNFRRLSEEGKKLQENGEFAKSKAAFDKAINICIQLRQNNEECDLSSAYGARGNLQAAASNYELATEDYRKAVKLTKELPSGLAYNYANSLSQLNRFDDAIQYYDTYIQSHPEKDYTYFERGNARLHTDKLEEAIADFTKALEIGDRNEYAQMSLANRGVCSYKLGDISAARDDLQSALDLNPIDVIAKLYLGLIHAKGQEREEAIREFSEIIDIEPKTWEAYKYRGIQQYHQNNFKASLRDLEVYIKNDGQDESAQAFAAMARERLTPKLNNIELAAPSTNLQEWRCNQALLARNAAYIQTYERYSDLIEAGEESTALQKLQEEMENEYMEQLETSIRYRDAYCLFRIRNLTYACMAVNMNGQRLEDRDAFGKYFLHPLFDKTDTRLREVLSSKEISIQTDKANELERYIVYACSCYCNKLLNLIDKGCREERDSGEHFEEFLEVQKAAEDQRKVDEIYVVREAMIWTIASTNIDLVTSAEESDAFEVKAFEMLSATNRYFSDYGEGPYRKEDIIDAICNHRLSHLDDENGNKSYSDAEYRKKLDQMTMADLTQEAGELEDTTLREFLNHWGPHGKNTFEESRKAAEKTEYTIEELRQAVINDYAFQCYQDGGTKADETSLKDYKAQVSNWTWEELMEETHIISEEESFRFSCSLSDYMDSWLNRSEYADIEYIENDDGSTTIKSVMREIQGGE